MFVRFGIVTSITTLEFPLTLQQLASDFSLMPRLNNLILTSRTPDLVPSQILHVLQVLHVLKPDSLSHEEADDGGDDGDDGGGEDLLVHDVYFIQKCRNQYRTGCSGCTLETHHHKQR